MKSKSYIIIIFFVFIFLTGCEKNNDYINKQIKYINQLNRLDKEYFTIYEQLSGIELSKQKIITKIEENAEKDAKNDTEKDALENKKEIVETTDIEQRDGILNDAKETNWKNSRKICEQLQDLVIDVQIEMKENEVDENIINEYKIEFDRLLNYIINEDKEKSIESISNLLEYSLIFVERCISSQEIFIIKKAYYTSMNSLIYLEFEDEEKLNENIVKLKNSIDEINQKIMYSEIEYIKKRINNIVSTIELNQENEELENTRLKLVMLIETIPSIENYIQELTIR